jgi:uncharacterized protein (UPF0276 family)
MSTLLPGAGIGLKPQHYRDVLALGRDGPLSFVEVHPQNYFGAGGPPHRWLGAIAERFALSFHSVGLSIGQADGLDAGELEQLAALVDRYAPAQVSDHLAWCATGTARFPDLLPLPMTLDVLGHVADQVSRVQDRLQRPILVENPARMLDFAADALLEAEFLNGLARRTGCGILLDLNNVEVSATNLGLSPWDMLDQIDLSHVGEIHMAGHALERHDGWPLAIDNHGSQPSELCWALLEHVLDRAGPRPVLIEWDTDVPAFALLLAQAARADALLKSAAQACEARHAVA